MPPNGFNSVSIDDETAALLDEIIDIADCDSRAEAIDLAAGEYLGVDIEGAA